ncbi:MAG: hypothetical protein LBQ06_05880, partial [Frankiaceae bacterium]|nr:hypothetical protein [Frankiaceae bacterium]
MLAGYGTDVLDPQVTARRIHVLATRMPPQWRTPGEQWTTEAHLLAALIDHVAQLTYITLKANGAKSVTKPKPVPRPGRFLPGGAATPSAAAPSPAAGPVTTGSWSDAAKQLALVKGVIVSGDGDLQLRRAAGVGVGRHPADDQGNRPVRPPR